MKPKLICLLLFFVFGGCSTYAVDRYSISADNVTALRALDIGKISVGEFTSFKPGLSEIMCRGEGPVKTPDGNTFAEYIRKSLIGELQIAEIYSPGAPVILTGHLENINFSSVEGKWNSALTIKSSNGRSILVHEEYTFTPSWMADTACDQTAQALMPSVQNLIRKIVTNQDFPNLVSDRPIEEQKLTSTPEAAPTSRVTDHTTEPKKVASIPKEVSVVRVSLRKKPLMISDEEQIDDMLIKYGFFDTSRNALGDFENNFFDNNNGTVTDMATGLMWQKSGSTGSLNYGSAKRYVNTLNHEGFAGHSDWRMPTVEELASLLKKEKSRGIHIYPVFDNKKITCWTVDTNDTNFGGTVTGVWIIDFRQGEILQAMWSFGLRPQAIHDTRTTNYVKAVRSIR